jgi:hypothetical protein
MREATRTVASVRRFAPLVVPIVSLLAATACVHPGHGPVKPTVPTGPTTIDRDRPPPVVVEGTSITLELTPFTFCWVRLCADGRPPENPPDIGPADHVTVRFPVESFSFSASFEPVEPGSGTGTSVDLTRTGPTTHELLPDVPAGTYDVLLVGSGDNKDVVVAFRWRVIDQ